MAAGDTISGSRGTVLKKPASGSYVELEIMDWSMTKEVSTERYGTNKSGGFNVSEPGNKQASGTVAGKRVVTSSDTKIENILAEGDQITLMLELDDTSSSENGWQMPATIKSLQVGANPGTGEQQAFQFAWESNGEWTYYTSRPSIS